MTLFIEAGLIVKNTAATPEISSVRQFIEPRLAMFRSGEMTRFNEAELSESTEIFGKVAHRFNSPFRPSSRRCANFCAPSVNSTLEAK
jgi:hypothetical protein